MPDPAGDRNDRDADAERSRMKWRRGALRRPAPGDPFVHSPVDLVLDPVEETGDQLGVVGRAELLTGREGCFELVSRDRFHAETLALHRLSCTRGVKGERRPGCVPSYAAAQLTFGFHIANVPLGLCFQIQAWSE